MDWEITFEFDDYAVPAYRTFKEWAKEDIPSGFYPEGFDYVYSNN